MRLFLAVPLSPPVREALRTAQADLRRPGGAGRRLLPSFLPGGGRPLGSL